MTRVWASFVLATGCLFGAFTPAKAATLSDVAQIVADACIATEADAEAVRRVAAERGWRPLPQQDLSRFNGIVSGINAIDAWAAVEDGSSIFVTLGRSGDCGVHFEGVDHSNTLALMDLTIAGERLGQADRLQTVQFRPTTTFIATWWRADGWRVNYFSVDPPPIPKGVVLVCRGCPRS